MIAVVGLGQWGERHVATLCRVLGRDEVVGVDPVPERRAVAERLGVRTVTDADALPAAVDAAVVVTPTATHAAVAGKLIERGLHLLVEKPLAADAGEAAAVVDAAHGAGVKLMVGHVFLYQQGHERLRDALRSLGPLRLIVAERRTPGFVKPDSGAWLELAPHELAVALDLGALGPETRVEAYLPWSLTGLGREDGAVARLRSNGCATEVRCSWLSGVRSRSVWVLAEGGQVLLVDDGNVQRLAVVEGEPTWIDARPDEPRWEVVDGVPPLERELRAFLDAVHGNGGADLRSDGRLGLRVVELLEQVSSWQASS